jgi:hypothetical protein
MRSNRIIAIGAATFVAVFGIAAAAQAAYVATGTLYGSDSDVISTVDCAAAIISSTADDQAKTIEAEDIACTKVTVKVYYTNSAGYAGWSSTVESSWRAIKTLSGADQLSRSYHTAVR